MILAAGIGEIAGIVCPGDVAANAGPLARHLRFIPQTCSEPLNPKAPGDGGIRAWSDRLAKAGASHASMLRKLERADLKNLA